MVILSDEEFLDTLRRLQTEKGEVTYTEIFKRILVEKSDPFLNQNSLKTTLSRKRKKMKKLGYIEQDDENYQITDEGIEFLNLNRDRLTESRFYWKEMTINGLTASFATVQNPGRIIGEKDDKKVEEKVESYLKDLQESNIEKDFTIKIHQREKRNSSCN
jgi:hypothetical protein